jgi:cob(I)alamin adenosyltransferase
MAKIYTKTGDKGTTGLVSGNRVSKGDARIDLYGDVDELNSFLGFTICSLQDASLIEFLRKIQSVLFDLGSNLACEEANRLKFKLPQVSEKIIADLEFAIDGMDSKMMTLKNFILPGGIEAAGEFIFVERFLVEWKEN